MSYRSGRRSNPERGVSGVVEGEHGQLSAKENKLSVKENKITYHKLSFCRWSGCSDGNRKAWSGSLVHTLRETPHNQGGREHPPSVSYYCILHCVPRLQGCCSDVMLAGDELGAVIEPSLDIFMDVVFNILVGVFALFAPFRHWRNMSTGRSHSGGCRAGFRLARSGSCRAGCRLLRVASVSALFGCFFANFGFYLNDLSRRDFLLVF
jgi:hypothetical protein